MTHCGARRRGWRASVGAGTSVLALLAFVLLVAAIWLGDDTDALWQAWGACALAALCGSQASLVLRGQRRGDTPLVTALVWTSIADRHVRDRGRRRSTSSSSSTTSATPSTRLVGVVLVVTVLTTALPPIMRRLNRSPAASPRSPLTELADQLSAAAGRVERVETPADARREAAALRELADRARG